MKTFLRWLGIVVLFLAAVFMYLNGLAVAYFRGDQIVAVYALQWGAIALVSLLIVAIVARAKSRSMRPWLVSFAGLAVALLLVIVASWHIIDRKECPAYPERRAGGAPVGCFNPQLQELEK